MMAHTTQKSQQLRVVSHTKKQPPCTAHHCRSNYEWLGKLTLNWQQLHAVKATETSSVSELLDKYSDLFKDELGTLKDVLMKFDIKDSFTRKFHKVRPVPYFNSR